MLQSLANKFGNVLKGRDLFGIPVQLTYRGQASFQTIFGGLVSLLFLLTFALGFFYQLFIMTFEPQFYNYPPRYDFSETKALVQPRVGNTFAVALQVFNETD